LAQSCARPTTAQLNGAHCWMQHAVSKALQKTACLISSCSVSKLGYGWRREQLLQEGLAGALGTIMRKSYQPPSSTVHTIGCSSLRARRCKKPYFLTPPAARASWVMAGVRGFLLAGALGTIIRKTCQPPGSTVHTVGCNLLRARRCKRPQDQTLLAA
jgi:hypothetical protein